MDNWWGRMKIYANWSVLVWTVKVERRLLSAVISCTTNLHMLYIENDDTLSNKQSNLAWFTCIVLDCSTFSFVCCAQQFMDGENSHVLYIENDNTLSNKQSVNLAWFTFIVLHCSTYFYLYAVPSILWRQNTGSSVWRWNHQLLFFSINNTKYYGEKFEAREKKLLSRSLTTLWPPFQQ